jgi:RNA ligase
MINYDFPHITHINDVLPHVEGREEFRVLEKDVYTVIKYMVALEDTFLWDDNDPVGSAVRRECRGISFNENGDLICRKYHKFFNAGEKEETQLHKINLYEPHIVLQKLDGSLISCQPTADGFVLVTKSGVTDISQQAEAFISDKPHYSTFIKKCIQKGTTPLFEWCSRKNRIVIDYPEDQLILTGIRYNDTGFYLDYGVMKTYATSWNIPVVKAVDGLAVQNIELFVKQVREWENDEGVVVRFDTGHMIKVKADDYVLRHKSKDAISQEKNVLQTILDDSVDDLVPLLTPEDGERIQRFQKAFWASVEDVSYEMAQKFLSGNTVYPDKKDFAVEFVQKKVDPTHAPVMYGMKGGKGSRGILVEMIAKSLSSQSKIDAARWMWGGLKWN